MDRCFEHPSVKTTEGGERTGVIGKTMEELSAGESAELSKTVFEFDAHVFAAVSGNHNSTHINGQFAAKTSFKRRLANYVCAFRASVTAELPTPATNTALGNGP